MNIVVVGHVDHGKSTVIGRLLADTGSLPEGKLEQIQAHCEQNSKVFEYAFLLDALDNERDQGITIDMARCFFNTAKRKYIILDAPGHIEFLKNMISGASRAEAAVLVIDAKEGIQENSRRHALLVSMLGVNQVLVAINKMDLVEYSEEVYNKLVKEFTAYLKDLNIKAEGFIPISAIQGENIAQTSSLMPWFKGSTILESLDEFKKQKALSSQDFRMPIQDIYKFTAYGDDKRICVGRIESGSIQVGDEVLAVPSLKKSRIKSIEVFNADKETVFAGESVGFTFTEEVFLRRGEILCKTKESISHSGTKVRANIFWMGREPMQFEKPYFLKLGTSKTEVRLKKIYHVVNSNNLSEDTTQNKELTRHTVADVLLETRKPFAFDLNSDFQGTGRFVIVDNYEISGGGIIRSFEAEDAEKELRDEVLKRELNFIQGRITPLERSERLCQRPTLVVVTGGEGSGHKEIAQSIEEVLFRKGRFTYYLAMGSVKHGIDIDLSDKDEKTRREHIRRLGEVCHLMLNSGLITIVSARDITAEEAKILKSLVKEQKVLVLSLDASHQGENVLNIQASDSLESSVSRALAWLKENDCLYFFNDK